MEAKATGKLLQISTKQSVEICSFLRGKTTDRGKQILERVLEMKEAIPYKRYNHNVGHRPGKMAAGRYPLKAASQILNLLKNAEANAEAKGLSKPFVIKEMLANQGVRSWHPGRQRRRKTKSTHIKILLHGTEIKETKEKAKIETKK